MFVNTSNEFSLYLSDVLRPGHVEMGTADACLAGGDSHRRRGLRPAHGAPGCGTVGAR